MRLTRDVTLGRELDPIQVRELTVGEIRSWLRNAESLDAGDTVSLLLFEEVTLDELRLFIDLNMAMLEILTPSEIAQLIEAAQELNPRFFAMRGRLAEVGRRLQTSGSAPSAPSSDSATPAPGTTP